MEVKKDRALCEHGNILSRACSVVLWKIAMLETGTNAIGKKYIYIYKTKQSCSRFQFQILSCLPLTLNLYELVVDCTEEGNCLLY